MEVVLLFFSGSSLMKFSLFGFIYDVSLSPFIGTVRREMSDQVSDLKGVTVLDICCGTGNQLKRLRTEGIGAMGVDIDASMLSRASSAGLHVSLQDAANLGIKSSSVDRAMITLALHDKDVETCRLIITEAGRVIKKGGLLVLCDFNITAETSIFPYIVIHFFEMVAGKKHFENFKSYKQTGQLNRLTENSGFVIVREQLIVMNSFKITVLKKL